MKVRVLAARPGLRVPITDAMGHPLRGAQGAISVTETGLLYEHDGHEVPGPVLVDDSLNLREQIRVGDIRIVEAVPAATEPPAPSPIRWDSTSESSAPAGTMPAGS